MLQNHQCLNLKVKQRVNVLQDHNDNEIFQWHVHFVTLLFKGKCRKSSGEFKMKRKLKGPQTDHREYAVGFFIM